MPRTKLRAGQGQGMTEYIIIIALIAITSIAVIRIFGNAVKYQMAESINALLGDGKPRDIDKPKLTKTAAKRRSLKDFARANDEQSDE